MHGSISARRKSGSILLQPLTPEEFPAWSAACNSAERRWAEVNAFSAQPGSFLALPAARGAVECIVAGIADRGDPWALGALPMTLPPADYHLPEEGWTTAERSLAAFGWALGSYRFGRYRAPKREPARLAPHLDRSAARQLQATIEAVHMVRDLVNTPAADLMPEQLAEAVKALAERHGAKFAEITGKHLERRGFPTVYAVGRASLHPPRLLRLDWGDPSHPRVALLGKGVCFDSGGLDLKSSAGMRLMKKDMGGAAHALGLAHLVMSAGLPVRLSVLVPAVENAVSGDAYRPGDVLRTAAGISVEVDNTDAEGRLVLCDALSAVAREAPACIIDFATLTGAARTALGPDLPALFCNDEPLAEALLAASRAVRDPLWRMPLFAPYRDLLKSQVADTLNSAPSPYAGAITAALFLQHFVPDTVAWAHLDLMAWNTTSRPGRPEGGEAMGLRAAFECLRRKFQS